ncbi:MAG: Carboxy-terminal domain (CTD) phosphatase [Alyxoria varia]|nr:MAG: Carboxy-terminal domain (CTD) phosphatase [Alyxoria varia]
MLLQSPTALHYPVTVTELLKRPQDYIDRSAPLFRYSFRSTVVEDDDFGEEVQVEKTFPAVFESEVEGTVLSWKIQKGSVINGPNAPLAEIDEPCKHDVQYGGLCVQCGQDVTLISYNTTRPDVNRADTSIAHVNTALKISRDEAGRIDQDAKQRLLGGRKLSLVVDLDLTVIHATVDPTIGEWQADENNPNHGALQDVRSFVMAEDPRPGHPRNTTYYIKLRPGLASFLEHISTMYELHIYTMGTRAYADNIVKLLDPKRKLFGDRVLSRTENAGDTQHKNIRKMFPVDNKMVVIIDDRADVWNWSKYLVQVKPFNFFVGIGDLNSSFLPKKEDMMAKPKKVQSPPDPRQDEVEGASKPEPKPKDEIPAPDGPADNSEKAGVKEEESTLNQIVAMQGDGEDSAAMEQKAQEQDETLNAQVNERPLLQQQKQLDEEDSDEEVDFGIDGAYQKHNLLRDDDKELERIEAQLTNIHRDFYRQYESRSETPIGMNGDQVPGPLSQEIPDVKDTMGPYRTESLRGTRLVFSGIVPVGVDVFTSHYGKLALRLGAQLDKDLTKDTTHLIARHGEPTSKMRIAARSPTIKMVSVDWLWESSQNWWDRIDETPYLITLPNNNKTGDLQVDDTAPPSDTNSEANGKGHGLAISIDHDARGGDDDDDDDDGTGIAISPITDMNDDDWAEAYREIADLSSDEGDGEDGENDEADQDEDDEDDLSSTTSEKSQQGEKKRKRRDEDDADGGLTQEGPDSDLQARKRQALARTTSLANVVLAEEDDTHPNNNVMDTDPTTEANSIEAEMNAIFGPTAEGPDEEDSDEDEGWEEDEA